MPENKEGKDTMKFIFKALWLIIFIGVALSLIAFQVVGEWEKKEILEEFERLAGTRVAAFKQEIHLNLEILQSVERLFKASQIVSREKFQIFVASTLARHPEIQALEWVPRVPDSERERYETDARQAGLADFQITERQAQGDMIPARQRSEYFPVYYIEPLQGNEAALGFDLASNATRLATLEQSRDNGHMLATARITLVQENAQQSGFLIFLPMYSGNPATVAERRESLRGFALGVFRIGDMFETGLRDILAKDAGIVTQLFDESASADTQLLYSGQSSSTQRIVADIVHRNTLDVAGRTWSMVSSPTADFIRSRRNLPAIIILLAGLLLSGLLAAYLYAGGQRQIQIARVANDLRQLIDTANAPIFGVDTQGHINEWNRMVAHLTGYSRQEVFGQSLVDTLISDAYQQSVQNVIEKALQGQQTENYECPVITKNGQTAYLLLNSTTRRDERGGVVGVVGVGQDITGRKHADEELRKFKAISDRASYGVAITDVRGNFLYCNATFAAMLECRPDDMVGQHLSVLFNDAQMQGAQALIAELERSGSFNAQELWYTKKDGSVIPTLMNAAVIVDEDDTPLYWSATIIDITERKQAEQVLRESEERFKNIAEVTPMPLVIINADDNTVLFANNAFEHLFGFQVAQLIGNPLPEFCKNPADRETILKRLQQEKELLHYELPAKKADSSNIWVIASFKLLNFDNQPAVFAGFYDMTGRKKAEEELAQERRNLEHAVEARTEELRQSLQQVEDANLRLQDVNRAKSRFLSSMSHELRTPLNGILGFADLLRGQFFGPLNEKQLGYVKQVDDSGKHLLSLISDLLDMAKIDAGAMELELASISAEECCEAITDMMGSQFRKKSITLEAFVDPALDVIAVDSRKMKQIMLNLLSNALKFTPEGGQVEIRAIKTSDSQLQITVSDSGIGIKADEIEKIFSEFHQADRVRDEQLGGTGIGLALTRRLVELHGGDIGAESEPGKGSTFRVTIPLKNIVPPDMQTDADAATAANSAFSGHRILVVEDNEVNLALILDMLSIQKHNVVVARNGQEAVELAQSHKPELILMDIRMPVMGGVEAAGRLRQIPAFAEIPIIALTASVDAEASEQHIAAGCTEQLSKPIQSKELFETLAKYLT